MASGLLRFLGLARSAQLRAAGDRAVELTHCTTEIETRLEASKLDAERWKWKHEQLTARLKTATKDTERWKAKTDGQHDLLAKLRRLDVTEQSLRLAREHLMAMETKLDVVEGAINVLDQRTRALIAPQDPDPLHHDPDPASHRE